MPKKRWYGKGFHHRVVEEIPVSECQCGNGVSGFGAFLKGFLQERINATPMHLRKDEDGTALHLLRDRGALRSEKAFERFGGGVVAPPPLLLGVFLEC
jgi:hypothetical protein